MISPRIHSEYARVFLGLKNAGIAWCVLRPLDDLPEIEKDLDLLVDPDARAVVHGLLAGLGYHVYLPERANPGKTAFVRWTGERAVYLDVHFEIIARGFVYHDADGTLARREQRGDLFHPAPADLYVVTLLHDVLGKERVQAKYHESLRALVVTFDGSPAQTEVRALGDLVPSDAEALERLLGSSLGAADSGAPDSGDVEVQDLAERMRRRLAGKKRFRRWWWRVRLRFRRPLRGFSIAFLGPDGAGKSTTMAAFQELVEGELRWPVATEYMGPWGHDHLGFTTRVRCRVPDTFGELRAARRERIAGGFRPSLRRAFALEWQRRRRELSKDEEQERLHQRETSWMWICFRFVRGHVRYGVFLSALWVELWWRHLKVRRRARRAAVICDRYVFDLLTGEMHEMTRRYHWARRLFCALFPKPNVTVYLFEEPEVLCARKDDLDLATMREMQILYESMMARWDFSPVRTNVPPPEVARRVLDETFSCLVARRR